MMEELKFKTDHFVLALYEDDTHSILSTMEPIKSYQVNVHNKLYDFSNILVPVYSKSFSQEIEAIYKFNELKKEIEQTEQRLKG